MEAPWVDSFCSSRSPLLPSSPWWASTVGGEDAWVSAAVPEQLEAQVPLNSLPMGTSRGVVWNSDHLKKADKAC